MRDKRFRIGAAVVLALVVGLSSGSCCATPEARPRPRHADASKASVDQIRTLADSVGHPVFWLGPREGYTYEVTQTSNGSIYVRYLPPGEKVGVKTPYLTVATYPFPGAYRGDQESRQAEGRQEDRACRRRARRVLPGRAAKRPRGVPGRRLPGRGLRSDTRYGNRPRDHGSAGSVREAQVPIQGAAHSGEAERRLDRRS